MSSLFFDYGALFNDDRTERYLLWRIWDDGKPILMGVGLNPSKADENRNDPTITRFMNYAKSNGYGGIYFCNVYPFRSTDPDKLYEIENLISIVNEQEIMRVRGKVDVCVICWGNHGSIGNYGRKLASLLAPVKCFGMNNNGTPKHPCRFLTDDMPMMDYVGNNYVDHPAKYPDAVLDIINPSAGRMKPENMRHGINYCPAVQKSEGK